MKELNDEKWTALDQMSNIIETVRTQQFLLLMQEQSDDPCGAITGYDEAFDQVLDKVQSTMDQLSELTAPFVEDLTEALEIFRYAKIQAIAQCPKPDCPDIDTARKELGWSEENDGLLLQ